jgi:hypothetical protein
MCSRHCDVEETKAVKGQDKAFVSLETVVKR